MAPAEIALGPGCHSWWMSLVFQKKTGSGCRVTVLREVPSPSLSWGPGRGLHPQMLASGLRPWPVRGALGGPSHPFLFSSPWCHLPQGAPPAALLRGLCLSGSTWQMCKLRFSGRGKLRKVCWLEVNWSSGVQGSLGTRGFLRMKAWET